MSSDGKQIRQLTEEPQHADEPAWPPDRDGNWEIYIMNADGANPIDLTNHPARDNSPSWGSIRLLSISPEGKLATLWGKVKRAR